jgi:hypothetical protein
MDRQLSVTSWLGVVPHFSLLCKVPLCAGVWGRRQLDVARTGESSSGHMQASRDDRPSTKVPRCMSMNTCIGRASRVATAFVCRPCGLHLPARSRRNIVVHQPRASKHASGNTLTPPLDLEVRTHLLLAFETLIPHHSRRTTKLYDTCWPGSPQAPTQPPDDLQQTHGSYSRPPCKGHVGSRIHHDPAACVRTGG